MGYRRIIIPDFTFTKNPRDIYFGGFSFYMDMKSLIKNNGPLNIAEFMNEAMFNPLSGYYCQRKPIGKDGDFITSPEISQSFGELIAAYFLNFILASPKKIALVEMGAGRGTLFKDILLTIKKISEKLGCNREIKERVTFHIIEISESLKKIQQENLYESGFQTLWHKDFTSFKNSAKDQEIYFFSNELFDCFPIHQFARTNAGWCEKLVDVIGNELVFTLENFNPIKDKMIAGLIPQELAAKNGDIFEHSFAALNFMNDLSKTLQEQGGIGLIIDYGYIEPQFKNTLQAVKNHQCSNVLKDVGKSDITALVNFSMLQNCAKNLELKTSLITQRDFLLSLGIEERRKILKDDFAINRLINKDQMGEIFKCLIIWR